MSDLTSSITTHPFAVRVLIGESAIVCPDGLDTVQECLALRSTEHEALQHIERPYVDIQATHNAPTAAGRLLCYTCMHVFAETEFRKDSRYPHYRNGRITRCKNCDRAHRKEMAASPAVRRMKHRKR